MNTDFRTPPGVVDDQMDDCYAICPYCGTAYGDIDEWVTQTDKESECHSCGKKFLVRAEYSVNVITTPWEG